MNSLFGEPKHGKLIFQVQEIYAQFQINRLVSSPILVKHWNQSERKREGKIFGDRDFRLLTDFKAKSHSTC